MMNMTARMIYLLLLWLFLSHSTRAQVLDEHCVVNILNRTVQVTRDGSWAMPNVPSQMGRIRARATCTRFGETFSGESDYFSVQQNGVVNVPQIQFDRLEPIPVSLSISEPTLEVLTQADANSQLKVLAQYRDGSRQELATNADGLNYASTNPSIVSVDANGRLTAIASGSALVSARKDEVVAFKRITVLLDGDSDHDGLPDDFERANGLDASDALDALEDPDADGLTTLQEYQRGCDFRRADSDGDGLDDGREVNGTEGFVTDPMKADSDGDGVGDNDEILAGYDPTNDQDGGGRGFVELLISPSNPTMTYNTLYKESNLQIQVIGKRRDGSLLDLTSKSTGTSYASSDLSVVSFGVRDGLLFAGQSGRAILTVRNAGLEKAITINVASFDPQLVTWLDIPGYANNVDVAGDYAYVAAGSQGLKVVQVSNHAQPVIIGSLDTEGTAIDVRVVGNIVYLADGERGLHIIDVSDPHAPKSLAVYDTAGIAQDIKIDQQFAYIADGVAGLEIVDVHKPSQPLFVATVTGLGEARGVDVQGSQAVVVAGTALYAIDVSDRRNPVKQDSLSIGPVKDVAFDGRHAQVAAYTSGWKTIDVADPLQLREIAGAVDFVPRDIEFTDGFAFAAEQLFRNFAVYLNMDEPEKPFFQGTINLSRLGEHYGTGLAIDGNYLYLTGQTSSIAQDYGSDGHTHLLIVQYRLVEDQGAVAPTLTITQPEEDSHVVEGQSINVTVDANDDIGVKGVSFLLDGQVLYTDSTRPYQSTLILPWGQGQTHRTLSARASDFGDNQQLSTSLNLVVEADTDHDGLADAQELAQGTDATDADSDDDGLQDGEEANRYTFANDADSDDDGFEDGAEVRLGTDPLNPDATAPLIVSILPAHQSTQIPENTPITVTFDEALSAKSIGADSLVVYSGFSEGAGRVEGRLRLSSDGLQLIFTPNELLADYSDYKVVVAGVRDRAGNHLADTHVFYFKTGNTLDVTAPNVVTVEPNHQGVGIAVNAQIAIAFTEPLNAHTLTEQSFTVFDGLTGERIGGVIEVSGDAQRVLFIPNRPLAVGRQFRIKLSSQIQDLFGNALANKEFLFTTSFDKDASGPRLLDFSLNEGQMAVPINAQLQIQFDEALSSLTLSGAELRKGAEKLAVTRSLSADRKTLTLKPLQPLSPNTRYSIEVDGLQDVSGNVQSTSQIRSFITGTQTDGLAPSIVQQVPLRDAMGVGSNTRIEVAFNELLNPLSVNSQSVKLYDDQSWQVQAASITLNADGKSLILKPTQPLASNRSYVLYLSNHAPIYDLAGNPVKAVQSTFTTGAVDDWEGPKVVARNLGDGVSGVAINSALRVSFDEAVSPFSVVGSVRLSSQGVDVPGSISLAADYRSLVFKPNSALNVDSDYLVTLTGLHDYAGNPMTAVNSGFHTASSNQWDVIGPTVIVSPVFATNDVSVDTPIRFTFNEPVDVSTLNSGITISANGFPGQLAGSFSVTGNVVTFQPATPLPGNTQINIVVNGLRDWAGNFNAKTDYFFTTGTPGDRTPPKLLSITPKDGSLDVNGQNPIVLTFSESLDQRTVTTRSVGLFVNGQLLQPTLSYSGDSRTITLRYGLPPSSIVTVLLTNDIKDLSGNPLQNTATVFATTAVDRARPSIVSSFPGSGAYDVLPDSKIVLYSNEALQAGTLANALRVSQNGLLIEGDWQLTGQAQTLIFTPTRAFAHDAIIELFLDSTAQDWSGNALNSFHTQFRIVEDPAKTLPYVVRTNQDQVLPLNPVFDLQFNEALDPQSIDDTTLMLLDGDTGAPIAAEINLLKANHLLRVTPTQTLLAHHSYYVEQRNELRDAGGQTSVQSSHRRWRFDVGERLDGLAPKLLAMSPADGASDVGTNSRLGIRFDEAVNPLSFLNEAPEQPFAQIAEAGGDVRRHSLLFSSDNRQVSYVPHVPWPSDSEVNLTINTPEDYAGHPVSATEWLFHTAGAPDTTPLAIEQWSMSSNAINVPVNAVFKIRMNKFIDILSLDEGSLYLLDMTTGERVAASRNVEADGRTLTLVPAQALAVGRRYCLYVYGVEDMTGNSVREARYFAAAMTADHQAPQVRGFSIEQQQRDVPIDPQLQVQFDEALSALRLDDIRLKQGDESIDVKRELSDDRMTVTLRLIRPLLAHTDYVLEVDAVEDLSGNRLATPQTLTFHTADKADLQPPQVLEVSPAENALEVGLNAAIVLSFSERLNPLTLDEQALTLLDTVSGRTVAVNRELSADGRRVTLTPKLPLIAYHLHSVQVSYTAPLFDQAGQRMPVKKWSFTTGMLSDVDAPSIKARSIDEGAMNVPVNSRLSFMFDEALSPFSVPGSVRVQAQGIDIAGRIELANDQRRLTFIPLQALANDSTYEVVIDGLYDYSGNRVASSSSQFLTSHDATLDVLSPSVTIMPANGTQGVGVNAPISLSFNEAIDPTTLDAGILIQATGMGSRVAGHFSHQDRLVSFHPDAPLPGNARIDVRVNGVLDLAGNAAVSSSQFVTGTAMDTVPPTLLAISPNDGALDVGQQTPMVLTFSESLKQSTVSDKSVGLFVDGRLVRPSISYGGDNRSIVLNYSLPSSSLITVLLTSDIQDLSGNPLPDTTRVFATAAYSDTRRPSIVSSFPGYGAFNVQTKNKIVLYSSESLQTSTVNNAFHVSQNGRLVEGHLQSLGDAQSWVFTPTQPWATEATIEVFLDSTALDLAGNSLISFQSLFTTAEDPRFKSPYVVATNLDDGIALPMNTVIDLQFNEALDPGSTHHSTLVLHDVATQTQIPVEVDLLKAGRLVRLQPISALSPGEYAVGIRRGLKDATGVESEQLGDYNWYFTVAASEDIKPPRIEGLSPGDGMSNVGSNSRIGMRFDEAINPLSLLGDDADLPLAQTDRYEDARGYSLNFGEQNRYVVYQPHEPWPANSDVELTVAAVEDYAGHVAPSLQHRFHTAMGADLQSPWSDEWSFYRNATDVPVNAFLQLRVNEVLDPLSVTDGSFLLYETLNRQTIAATTHLSPDGQTLTLVPNQAMAMGRRYTLDASQVKDMNGNNLYETRSFTTAFVADTQPPQVIGYSLEADQSGVATNPQLHIGFDEPVNALKLEGVTLQRDHDVLPLTRESSNDRKRLSLKLAQPLLPHTRYTLRIEAVEDLSGHVIAPQMRSFTTGSGADLSFPRLISYSPVNQASGVGVNTAIVLTFSEPIDPVSLHGDSVRLVDSQSGQIVKTLFEVSDDRRRAIMTPLAPLLANRSYGVYVSYYGAIYDQAGNNLSNTVWSFTP